VPEFIRAAIVNLDIVTKEWPMPFGRERIRAESPGKQKYTARAPDPCYFR